MTVRALLGFSLCAVAAVAQTNRNVALGVAPGLGVTSTYTATYPASATGRFGFFLLTLPELAAQPLVLPGFTSNGLVRVDLNNQLLSSFWLLDGTGSRGFSVPIPMDSVFQGFSFDVQTVDVDFPTNDLAWADNDLELTIGQGLVGQGLDMVRIQAGVFSMGSSAMPLDTAPYFNQDVAQPVHLVVLTQPFWIGKYEVTQLRFQAVMGRNPSAFVRPQRPVERVTWHDAMAYCAALTAQEAAAGRLPSGYQYRLPTEAEWEYCCRAGTTTEYWCGPTISCADANLEVEFHTGTNCSIGQTSDVGIRPANAWGLHDVAGNVWEWCLDGFDFTANYPSSIAFDPYVPNGAFRICRGGGWFVPSMAARSAYRSAGGPSSFGNYIGFRVVLGPILVP